VTFTERHPESWLQMVETTGTGLTRGETLTPEQEGDEFLLMGLRLAEGIELGRYETLSGRSLSSTRMASLAGEGLIAPLGNSRLKATPAGMLVLDAVVADLAR
jgi:oxygen-independent coproporphyrinogen-3 oxidase